MGPVLIGIIVVVVLIVLYAISTYNKLVRAKNKCEGQWAQIAVQLKRRADLIPNLVETVKGYAKHEQETFEAVIAARNQYNAATSVEDQMEGSNQITSALNKLFALSEAYPELKANENFLSLQGDLKDTEDKIAYARQFYNDDVKGFKNLLEMFPSNIIAGITGFKALPFFEVSQEDSETPKVSF